MNPRAVGNARTVGLFAVCDLMPARQGNAIPESRLEFGVEEFARLSKGQPVLLRELGWTSVASTGGSVAGALFLTEGQVLDNVRAVVQPDEAAPEGQHWLELAALLADKGVPASADELRDLPYDIVLTPRLRARLSAPES